MSRTCQACRPWALVQVVTLVLAAGGCGPGVKTYPVKGKVVFKGGRPVTDGRVQFQFTTDPALKALGDIGGDGSFTLTTYIKDKNVAGAPAGPHTVVVELERPARVVVMPNPYTVQPGENDFTIEVSAPSRR